MEINGIKIKVGYWYKHKLLVLKKYNEVDYMEHKM